jgi:hypothetical protein
MATTPSIVTQVADGLQTYHGYTRKWARYDVMESPTGGLAHLSLDGDVGFRVELEAPATRLVENLYLAAEDPARIVRVIVAAMQA